MQVNGDRLVLDLVRVPMAVYVQWVDRPEVQVRQHLARLGVAVDESVAKDPRVNMHEISCKLHAYLERQR